jgi:hypothetical protein
MTEDITDTIIRSKDETVRIDHKQMAGGDSSPYGPVDEYAHIAGPEAGFNVFHPTAGRPVTTTDGYIGDGFDGVYAIAHDPDNDRMFAGGADGIIREYPDSPDALQSFPVSQSTDPSKAEARSIAYDPTNDNVVGIVKDTDTSDPELWSWNAGDLSKNWEDTNLGTFQRATCDVASDGTIFVADEVDTIYKYDSSGTQQDTLTISDTPSSVVLTDGTIAVGVDEGSIRRYDTSLTEQWSTSVGLSKVWGVDALPDGWVAAAGEFRVLVLDNAGTVQWERSSERPYGIIGATPDDRVYVVYSNGSNAGDVVFVFDAADGSFVYTHRLPLNLAIRSAGRTVVAPRAGPFSDRY